MTTVGIVGSRDRQLEDLVKAAGMQPRALETGDLHALAGSNRMPDVLLLDTRGGGGIPPALAPLKRQHADVGVVIVAASLDPELLLEAMRAGVNELIADPVSQSDIERAMGRVLGQRLGKQAGKIYGFVGAKGGVGTTTVAVNVAAAFSKADKDGKTLLIDMHQAGGDAAVFAGAEPKFSILDAVENTHRLDASYFNGIVTQLSPRLDLLGSADRAFASSVDPARLRTVIDFASRGYQHVVLDLTRSDAAMFFNDTATTEIYTVANQELATVKSATRMASTLRQRFGRDKIKVVLSRSDRQAEIGLADVERAIGAEVSHSFPSDYRAALQALNKGRPLVFDGDGELVASFKKFVGKLTEGKTDRKAEPAKGGLFSRLTSSRK